MAIIVPPNHGLTRRDVRLSVNLDGSAMTTEDIDVVFSTAFPLTYERATEDIFVRL